MRQLRSQRLLEPPGAAQRRGPPEPVDVANRAGNLDPPFCAHLLPDQRAGKNRCQVLLHQRLPGPGMNGRRQGEGQVGRHIVPGGRNRVFGKRECDGILDGWTHRSTLLVAKADVHILPAKLHATGRSDKVTTARLDTLPVRCGLTIRDARSDHVSPNQDGSGPRKSFRC